MSINPLRTAHATGRPVHPKRHNLCDQQTRHYCNEQIAQAGIPTELFLTRKTWDVGNCAPYGHRDDLTTLTEAIAAHGDEARHIGRHPASGSARYAHELNLPGLRCWPLARYPHLVFYLEHPHHIDMWRLLHGRRDIPTWMQDIGGPDLADDSQPELG